MASKDDVLRQLSAWTGNGTIEKGQLCHILQSCDKDTWSDALLSELFAGFASNQDGTIQLDKFLNFVFQDEPTKYPEVTPGSKHYALDPASDDGKYLASKIWWFGPKFSPKDVPAFYDVSSITEDPECFRKVIDIFVERYKLMGETGPTHVLGYDARGFVIGPPIALALGIPFVLFRKDAKHPGVVVESSGYSKEYAEKKLDAMCMRLGAIGPGARVLLIDDLVATGGTALAGFELCNSCGIEVCEFAAVIDLPFCKGIEKIREYGGGRFKDTPVFTLVDGRQIPDKNCRDPAGWEEDSRVVPAPKAREMLDKYPNLDWTQRGVKHSSSPYAPLAEGTLLPNGSRWGACDPAGALFISGAAPIEDIFASQKVEIIASGFRWTEGPVWDPSSKALYFSDTIDARIYKWQEGAGVTVMAVDSGGYDGSNVLEFHSLFEPGSNGMALQGDDLYICQHPTHRILKTKLSSLKEGARFCDQDFEVLADKSHEGRRLNSPNDIIVAPNGDVFFSDPIYGFLKKQPAELGYKYLNAEKGEHPDQAYLDECCQREGAACTGVYRLRGGKLELVTKELNRPNGLALSHDGTLLWVANSDKDTPSWTAFKMREELPLERSITLNPETLGDEGLKPASERPGLSDGFKIDEQERIWSSAPGGMVVIDPKIKSVLAKVIMKTNIANMVFGDGGDVFVTGQGHVWRFQRKI